MNIAQHIYNYLLEHNAVILPEIGQFSLHERSAEFKDGVLLPPTKELRFDENRANDDDGALLDYICAKEGRLSTDVQNDIKNYVSQIQLGLLGVSRSFDMQPLGTLRLDERSDYQFDTNTESFASDLDMPSLPMEDTPAAFPPVEPITPVVMPTPKPEQPATTPPEDDPFAIFNTSNNKPTEPTTPEQPSKEEDPFAIFNTTSNTPTPEPTPKEPDANEPLFPPVATPTEDKPKPKETPSKKTPNTPPYVPPKSAPTKNKKEEKKKSSGWLVFIIILLLLILLLVVAYFFYAPFKSYVDPYIDKVFGRETPVQVVTEPQEEDTTPADTIPTVPIEPVTETIPETTQPAPVFSAQTTTTNTNWRAALSTYPNEDNGAFVLIVGSFQSYDNALACMEKLANDGFYYCDVIQHDDFYRVAISSYNRLSKAKAAAEAFRSHPLCNGVWVANRE